MFYRMRDRMVMVKKKKTLNVRQGPSAIGFLYILYKKLRLPGDNRSTKQSVLKVFFYEH